MQHQFETRLATLALLLVCAPTIRAQQPVLTIDGTQAEPLDIAVAGPGDVDGDGYADMLVGHPNGQSGGSVELYSGAWLRDGTGSALIHTWTSPTQIALMGYSVSGAGDVDADGTPDIVVGSPAESSVAFNSGRVTVYSGASGQELRSFYGNLSTRNGHAVAAAGDVNGDGYDDVLIGAIGWVTPLSLYAGRARVYSGEWITVKAAGGTPLTSRSLHIFDGDFGADHFGYALCSLGDLDADGAAEVAISAPQTLTGGMGYVRVFDGASGVAMRTYDGSEAGGGYGRALANLGDVNGDGVNDFAVGAPFAGTAAGAVDRGRVEVLSGEWLVSTYQGLTPASPRVLHDVHGELAGDFFGTSLTALGDVNQDNRDDWLVGAPRNSILGDAGTVGWIALHSGADGGELHRWSGAERERFGAGSARIGDLLGGAVPEFASASPASGQTGGGAPPGRMELFDGGDWTIGRRFCEGLGCPCGNDDPAAGCASSTGSGAVTIGELGSASASADDLVIAVENMPPFKSVLLFMGSARVPLSFGDGLLCTGAPIYRFSVQNSGATGRITRGPGLVSYSQAHFASAGWIAAGQSRYFQAWYRDPLGPCGSAFNLASGLWVSFTP